MNNFTFTGNLGKDSEVRSMPNGKAVCSFSVAVKSGFGDKEKTTWVNCGVFGKRAEGQLPNYLTKGAQVCISGEAFLDEWEKEGVTHKALKVNVDKLDLIGGNSGGKSSPKPQRPVTQQRPAPQAPQAPQKLDDGWDEDIPF